MEREGWVKQPKHKVSIEGIDWLYEKYWDYYRKDNYYRREPNKKYLDKIPSSISNIGCYDWFDELIIKETFIQKSSFLKRFIFLVYPKYYRNRLNKNYLLSK